MGLSKSKTYKVGSIEFTVVHNEDSIGLGMYTMGPDFYGPGLLVIQVWRWTLEFASDKRRDIWFKNLSDASMHSCALCAEWGETHV